MTTLKAIVLTKNGLGQLQVRADYDKEIDGKIIRFSEAVEETIGIDEVNLLSGKWIMVEALTEEL